MSVIVNYSHIASALGPDEAAAAVAEGTEEAVATASADGMSREEAGALCRDARVFARPLLDELAPKDEDRLMPCVPSSTVRRREHD